MNKTAIKNYAIRARVHLIEAVKQRAYEYEITEDGENKSGIKTVGDRLLTPDEIKQREQLIDEIRHKGYNQVMEEAAYTWFNRFIALRFMEVNGFLPSRVRVFTDESGAFKPEILKEAMTVDIDGLDRNKVFDLLDKQENEELFKYLIITQCNALNQGLPYMFEKISNWTELLFPANLLRSDSVIGSMIAAISEDDFKDEVEIIGWLYQFYITEKHEEVVDPLHGKIIKKEDIPAATQLFTTDWVVRYILDNSLGRYWIERHPESKLAEKLTCLATPESGIIETIDEHITPEELKVLDPCVGSGHFLSYAFDILIEIYRECGWSDRDAAKSILENNIYGIDIDDRAVQLACFAVAMKARKYNRRILNGETALNIVAMQDSDFITEGYINYFANNNESLRKDINEIRIIFNNAKEYGSIISVPKLNFESLYERADIIKRSFADDMFQMEYQKQTEERLLNIIKQAEILSKKYDIVATNPPYMNKYSPCLKDYINQHFANYKGDLFSVFIYRNFAFCKENGYSGFMTPMVWMFIKTYEELRKYVISQKAITTLIQFEYSAFEEATVPICSFVLKNGKPTESALCFRLSTFTGGMEIQKQKVLEAIDNKDCGYFHESDQSNFSKIPGSPIAYWVSDHMLKAYDTGEPLGTIAFPKTGMTTGDNNRFLRFWYEVSQNKSNFNSTTAMEAQDSKSKWFPYCKGGGYRRWYGYNEYLVNWFDNGYEIKNNVKDNGLKAASVRSESMYFKPLITWSAVTSGIFSCRYCAGGALFDSGGSSISVPKNTNYLLALLNSKVGQYILDISNATINYQPGDIAGIPVLFKSINEVEFKADINIESSKEDWDSFETSWDFKKHPLV